MSAVAASSSPPQAWLHHHPCWHLAIARLVCRSVAVPLRGSRGAAQSSRRCVVCGRHTSAMASWLGGGVVVGELRETRFLQPVVVPHDMWCVFHTSCYVIAITRCNTSVNFHDPSVRIARQTPLDAAWLPEAPPHRRGTDQHPTRCPQKPSPPKGPKACGEAELRVCCGPPIV